VTCVVNFSGTKIGDQACISEVETMKELLNLVYSYSEINQWHFYVNTLK